MTAQLCILYSDKARSFNQWQRALNQNFAIINHSYRQQFSHLPLPKFIPHTLGWFLLFCYRSKIDLNNYIFPFSRSPLPVTDTLFPVPCLPFSVPWSLFLGLYSLFPVPRSLFPRSVLPVPCYPLLFPFPCSLFSVLCFLFSVPCSPLPVANSLLPVPCSFFPSPFFIPYSPFPILILSFLFPNFEVNKAIQTDRQTSPSSPGCRTKC